MSEDEVLVWLEEKVVYWHGVYEATPWGRLWAKLRARRELMKWVDCYYIRLVWSGRWV